MRMSLEEIKDRLRRAARTLRLLPGQIGPKEYGSNWPEIVRLSWDALWELDDLGQWRRRKTKCSPSPPTAREISEMDETLPWLEWIDGDLTRRIVWGRACGIRWAALREETGQSREWLRLLEEAGLKAIARQLENGPKIAA